MTRRRIMTDAIKQVVREKYATSPSRADLAKECGCSVSSLAKLAREEGLHRSRRDGAYFKITPLQAKQIAQAYNRGLSCRAIQEHFGLSHQGILNVIRKEGGKVRSWKDHQDSIAKILAEVCAA